MRLLVTRREVRYPGRLDAVPPLSSRLLLLKEDGAVLVRADAAATSVREWETEASTFDR